jgi:hypothetical protein
VFPLPPRSQPPDERVEIRRASDLPRESSRQRPGLLHRLSPCGFAQRAVHAATDVDSKVALS